MVGGGGPGRFNFCCCGALPALGRLRGMHCIGVETAGRESLGTLGDEEFGSRAPRLPLKFISSKSRLAGTAYCSAHRTPCAPRTRIAPAGRHRPTGALEPVPVHDDDRRWTNLRGAPREQAEVRCRLVRASATALRLHYQEQAGARHQQASLRHAEAGFGSAAPVSAPDFAPAPPVSPSFTPRHAAGVQVSAQRSRASLRS